MAYAAGAVAAGAAGVQSADAAVIYTPGFQFAVAETKEIDFDGNGTEEFNIGHERTEVDGVRQPNTDRVILKDPTDPSTAAYVIDPLVGDNSFPVPLAPGTVIGPGSMYGNQFNGNVGNRIVDEDSDDNNVVDNPVLTNFRIDDITGNPQYLGVRFKLNGTGEDRYGYIGIDINNSADLTGWISEFAYETTGGPIEAGAIPEPSSGLALLAAGAAGLLRRKRA